MLKVSQSFLQQHLSIRFFQPWTSARLKFVYSFMMCRATFSVTAKFNGTSW